ncbi:MAG TPA: hypothetical protein PKD54_12480 [Pirellulaceae bacterium]|nr:hypothetical protein [Pirellulaceae bacterium]
MAVAPSDPKIIYVGGGEKTVRGNVSHGDGIWKSVDSGKTWRHLGLADSHHIPRIRIHPKNPQLAYVAALGHLYGPNDERGIYRSRDGGESWERILFVNADAGAVDLILDPHNPDTIYATTWRVRRTPYSLESGGEGSGLWKSTDGGETWTELTRNKGLPQGTVGIIGVAPSPVNPQRVWAIVEAEDGGLFVSDDGGETWRLTSDDRNLRQRAWYYTRVYASPRNANEVYVLNVSFHRSTDGGRTFQSIRTPHGDHHDLWIDPADPNRMIIADDGGAQVSLDNGATFSTYMNQPTAQFYRVTTDNHFPYRIYGAQQDNSTVRIFHRTAGGGLDESAWESTAGGESGHLAPDPRDPEVVYGGSYGGFLQRLDHRTGHSRLINVWPDNPMGHGAGDLKYRFQWNFPIVFSPHDPQVLYTAGNVLFKTVDEGQSWTAISGDLTRNEPSKLGPSGGPITKDNTSVEYYCTIFAVAESPHEAGTIWVGSDDGLIHITRDGGASWTNVTPPVELMPEWAQINSIEVHPRHPGGLYVAATRYKSDDFAPYLLKTDNYGETWSLIVDGIAGQHFTRVIRADPAREGLLFAGTENGLYWSFDDGAYWQPFQSNLPLTPITDMTIKDGDLIIATQGRSFWILDDLEPVRAWRPNIETASIHVFDQRPTYRLSGSGGGRGRRGGAPAVGGENLPVDLGLRFWISEIPDSEGSPRKVTFTDPGGRVVKTFSTNPEEGEESWQPAVGFNRLSWDLRYPDAETFEGMILWGGGTQGPRAAPGIYQAVIHWGDEELTVPLELRRDPRLAASDEDLQDQFDFLLGIRDKLTEIHRAIKRIREVRDQIEKFIERIKDRDEYRALKEAGQQLIAQVTEVEEALYQTKNRSGQDPLNYPIRLNNQLAGVASVVASSEHRPTTQSIAVRDELLPLIDEQLTRLETLLGTELEALNQQILDARVPMIWLK